MNPPLSMPMHVTRLTLFAALVAAGAASARGATVLRETYVQSVGVTVPDNNLSGAATSISTSFTSLGTVAKVTVGLQTTGGWNGDMYAYVSHDGTLTTLLNRPGRTETNTAGYGSAGMNLTLDDAAATDVHLASAGLNGTFQPDGRAVDPADSFASTSRTQQLSSFNGGTATGAWAVFMADVATGGEATWVSSTLTLQGDAALVGGADLVKNGTHTTAIVGAGDYTGQTIVNGGTLLLEGAGNHIPDTSAVTLAGGTLATGGLTETVGTLTLSGGGNSVIDLGTGTSFLTFADSSGVAWTGTLSIWNWSGAWGGGGTDRLFFGNGSGTGLTGAQLASITLYSDSGVTPVSGTLALMSSGELAPVPEPAAVLSLAALCGAVGWRERRSGQRGRRAAAA